MYDQETPLKPVVGKLSSRWPAARALNRALIVASGIYILCALSWLLWPLAQPQNWLLYVILANIILLGGIGSLTLLEGYSEQDTFAYMVILMIFGGFAMVAMPFL